MPKNAPIPTRFAPDGEALLKWVAQKSGLPLSEVVRRAVRLLNEEVRRRGNKVGWIVEELSPEGAELPPPPGASAEKKQAARKHAA